MNTVPPTARRPRRVLRTLASLVGLSIFNVFMVIPALVYASLLATVYATAFGFYIGGVAVTASGLAGQGEVALQGPLRQLMALTHTHFDSPEEENAALNWRLVISREGIEVLHNDSEGNEGSTEIDRQADAADRNSRIWDRAEAIAAGDVRVNSEFADGGSGARTAQSLVGLGLVLCGIILCLLGVVLTRYTLIGLRRYLALNAALLRSH